MWCKSASITQRLRSSPLITALVVLANRHSHNAYRKFALHADVGPPSQ
jgi:hypothetical protein